MKITAHPPFCCAPAIMPVRSLKTRHVLPGTAPAASAFPVFHLIPYFSFPQTQYVQGGIDHD
jgi:hypothetical protein